MRYISLNSDPNMSPTAHAELLGLALVVVPLVASCSQKKDERTCFEGCSLPTAHSFARVSGLPLEQVIDSVKMGALDRHEIDLSDVLLRIAQDLGEREVSTPLLLEDADQVKGEVFSMASLMLSQLQEKEAVLGRELTPIEQMTIVRDIFFQTGKRFEYPDLLDLMNSQNAGEIITFDQSWSSGIGVCEDQTGNLLSVIHALESAGVDLPIFPITCPNHIFVGWVKDGEEIYLELTTGGELKTREDYLQSFGLDPNVDTAYLKPEPFQVICAEMNNSAIGLLTQGKCSEALHYWELALRLAPNAANLHAGCASAFFGLAQQTQGAERFVLAERALSRFDQALELDPSDRSLFLMKVDILNWMAEKADDTSSALDYYDRAIDEVDRCLRTRHRPDVLANFIDWTEDTPLRMRKAEILEDRFKVSRDEQDISRAIEIFREDPAAKKNQSPMLLERMGAAHFNQYLTLGTSEALHSAKAEYESARELYEPGSWWRTEATIELSKVYLEMQEYEQVRQLLAEVLSSDHRSDDPTPHLVQALAFYELGEIKEARAGMKDFIRISAWESISSLDEAIALEAEREAEQNQAGVPTLWKYRKVYIEHLFQREGYRSLLESVLQE